MAGLGQRIYREWLSRIRQDAREMGSWALENIQTQGDLDYHYQQYLEDLQTELEDEKSLYIGLWTGKAEEEINRIKEKLTKKFNIPDSTGQDPDEDEEITSYADGTLLGFRIVTPSYKQTIIGLEGERRAQLFPTLKDLQEYINGIPRGAILGIEEVLDDKGIIRGFYVWVGTTS